MFVPSIEKMRRRAKSPALRSSARVQFPRVSFPTSAAQRAETRREFPGRPRGRSAWPKPSSTREPRRRSPLSLEGADFSRVGISLNRVRTFDAALHSLARSMVQPVQRGLYVRQRDSVFAAGIRAGLKRSQAIFDDRQQRFLADSVYADVGDRAILKTDQAVSAVAVADRRSIGFGFVVEKRNRVFMASAADAWFVHYVNFQGLV